MGWVFDPPHIFRQGFDDAIFLVADYHHHFGVRQGLLGHVQLPTEDSLAPTNVNEGFRPAGFHAASSASSRYYDSKL
jgi:hypothetical protein